MDYRKASDISKPIVFMMIDSTDHITGKQGIIPSLTISKNGGAFQAITGSVDEIGNGWYKYTPSSNDISAVGPFIIHAEASGADPTDVHLNIISHDPFNMANNSVGNIVSKTGYKLSSDGLDSITTTAPSGVASSFPEMVIQLWRRFFMKATKTTTEIKTYADDGTTVVTTQQISDDGTTETQGAAS